MKPFLMIVFFVPMTTYCLGEELEISEVIMDLQNKFDEPDKSGILSKIKEQLLTKQPRIQELARRLNLSPSSWTYSQISNDSLYSQIDALITNNNQSAKGLIAARVIRFSGKEAVSIIYWNRIAGDENHLLETKWIRRYLDKVIDETEPLPEWKQLAGNPINKNKLNLLRGLCDDPMPPTVVPFIARLSRSEAAIVEFVTNDEEKINYHWAVRSNIYTSHFKSFISAWKLIE